MKNVRVCVSTRRSMISTQTLYTISEMRSYDWEIKQNTDFTVDCL